MNFHIIAFTENGFLLAKRLEDLISSSRNLSLTLCNKESGVKLSSWTKDYFKKGNVLIFIGAAGIAVRTIAPFIKDKREDPAVLVIDEKASFVIPILSGHIGGGNQAAREIASLIGASPVITTASDVNNLPAIDIFAKENNLTLNDMTLAKDFAAKMLTYSKKKEGDKPAFTLSVYIKNDILNLIPRSLVLGIGCKKGKEPEKLRNFVFEALNLLNIDYRSLESINSVDLKAGEKAIISLSNELKLPFVTYSAEKLNSISQKVSHSDFVSSVTGTDNVCERAVFASGAHRLLLAKKAFDGMTLAIGIKDFLPEIPEDLRAFYIPDENLFKINTYNITK